jgi:hypothetical protein
MPICSGLSPWITVGSTRKIVPVKEKMNESNTAGKDHEGTSHAIKKRIVHMEEGDWARSPFLEFELEFFSPLRITKRFRSSSQCKADDEPTRKHS